MAISVLVVDDSSTIRKIISRCLQSAALGVTEVVEAGNGQEALELLGKRTVDVVITNINMPRMNGMQLLCAIQQCEAWKGIPVLVISTEARADAVVEAIGKGAKGYIKKPFTPAEIHDQLAPLVTSAYQS